MYQTLRALGLTHSDMPCKEQRQGWTSAFDTISDTDPRTSDPRPSMMKFLILLGPPEHSQLISPMLVVQRPTAIYFTAALHCSCFILD